MPGRTDAGPGHEPPCCRRMPLPGRKAAGTRAPAGVHVGPAWKKSVSVGLSATSVAAWRHPHAAPRPLRTHSRRESFPANCPVHTMVLLGTLSGTPTHGKTPLVAKIRPGWQRPAACSCRHRRIGRGFPHVRLRHRSRPAADGGAAPGSETHGCNQCTSTCPMADPDGRRPRPPHIRPDRCRRRATRRDRRGRCRPAGPARCRTADLCDRHDRIIHRRVGQRRDGSARGRPGRLRRRGAASGR